LKKIKFQDTSFASMALVDVIIPTFNRQLLLKRVLDSVYQQTFKDYRVWVVNDGSTDETATFLEQQRDPRLHIIHLNENCGVSAARNAGIQAGSAPFVALLDSDDEWKPDKLEKQIRALNENPHHALNHSQEIWWRDGVEVKQPAKFKKSGGWIFDRCVEVCCISPSTAVIRRRVLEEVGLFREDFVVCEDFEMWLRITSRFEVGLLDESLVIKHGGHEDQLSMKYKAMDYWRVKALMPYLDSSVARVSIIKRGEILLSGYEKYGRAGMEVEKVRSWLQQATR